MVSERVLKRWMREVRNGHRPPQVLLDELRRLPFENVGVAKLDTHRRLRRGIPEVVFGEGKTPEQLIRIIQRLLAMRELVLVTRLDPSVFTDVHRALPSLRYHPVARLAYHVPRGRLLRRGFVAVLSGGTSDLPIAEEAVLTLELLGSRAVRLYDVGVAGVHRLLSQWRLLQRARVLVVVAGMEGALPGVVAGMVEAPVIGVPVSTGYGAAFSGVSALLTMLNSCSSGLTVVNIDNGFGAGYAAALILAGHRRPVPSTPAARRKRPSGGSSR